MMLYLAKSSACLLLLLGLYKFALEPEKMHRFNRAYLLGSLVFSLLVPVVPLPGAINVLPALETTMLPVTKSVQPTVEAETPAQLVSAPTAGFVPEQAAWLLYWIVCAVLLGRFIHNLLALARAIRTSPTVRLGNAQLVLMADNRLPYTFLTWIFVNQATYENHALEPELFTHELAHVRQSHSLDILFVELLRVFGWFNPLLTGYKRAIQLNHEFLADDAVNATHHDITAYRRLLLSQATGNSPLVLTSALTFQPTKQRFLMMTRQTAPARAIALKLLTGLLLPVLTLVFGGAAMPVSTPHAPNATPAADATRPTSQTDTTAAKKAVYYKNTTFKTKDKAGNIITRAYAQLTIGEQAKLYGPPPPLPRIVPTDAQLRAWQDSKKYGLWIDDKRVKNSVLTRYKPADFASYFVSKLEKNAFNYGKHYYQVDIMTHANYAAYLKEEAANPSPKRDIRYYRN